MTDRPLSESERDAFSIQYPDARVAECACRTCECYVEAEEGCLCLGCEHGVHPGEQE